MQKLESYQQLAAAMSAQLRRGVVTNCFLSAADGAREVRAGLLLHEEAGALLLLRDRRTHYVLNFYLQPGARFSLPAFDKPVVTELAYRPKDEAAMLAAASELRALGFSEVLRRTRRTRAAAPAAALPQLPQSSPSPCRIGLPQPCRSAAVNAFLRSHFSALTGCLPTADTLSEALAAGQMLCAEDDAGICGLLDFAPGRTSSEIRHLAIRADCRGRGIASSLFSAYLSATGGQKSVVWARTGNLPAEHFYESQNYQPDGWKSIVLQLGGTEL